MAISTSCYLKIRLAALILTIVVLLLPGNSLCTEEYAQKTGQSCDTCHVDPSGGGQLTAAGKAYQATINLAESATKAGFGRYIFRLSIGFLHIITGFFWFGTILYVHLVLKPRYAAQGLPRGEMLVGLCSMIAMAFTGSVLTFYRITSLDILFHTRFGILLLVKIALFLMMVIAALFVVLVLGPRLRNKKDRHAAEQKEEITITDLAQLDGKQGKPAWFAYNGQVFDATASKLWCNGEHMGRHSAGMDLTGALKLAPHDEDKILAMPVAARLLGGAESSPMTPTVKVFYFMAYLNLVAVFGVVLILALWSWG